MMRVEERDKPTNYKDKAVISALVPKELSSSSTPVCSAKHLSALFQQSDELNQILWLTEHLSIHTEGITVVERSVHWLVIGM